MSVIDQSRRREDFGVLSDSLDQGERDLCCAACGYGVAYGRAPDVCPMCRHEGFHARGPRKEPAFYRDD